jgi:histidinol-phosphate aminotransferase
MRVGYGFAHEDLIANLLKVKLPFEPSAPAEAAGIAALGDREFLRRSVELNHRGLRLIAAALSGMGFTPAPSGANFIMVPFGTAECARRIYEGLLKQGIIVRALGAFGLPNCLRISTGLDEHNQRLIDTLARVKAEVTA